MADPIDPRLQYTSLPPRTLPQSYTASSNLQNNGAAHQPYYLPATNHQHAPPSTALDPALEEPSPGLHEASTDNENDADGDHDGSSAKSPGDLKRPRACDSCRGLKVRCDQDPTRPDLPCRRCAKANRQCITTPPTRKRQKKADSRVAELERKIDALTATIQAQKTGGPGDNRPYSAQVSPAYDSTPPQLQGEQRPYRGGAEGHEWGLPNRLSESTMNYISPGAPNRSPNNKRRRVEEANSNPFQSTIPEDMDAIHKDMTENADPSLNENNWGMMRRGHKKMFQADHSYINGLIDNLMDADAAEKIFKRYVNDICPHFPAVPLAPGTTVKELREKKPLLFLAILAGSSHGNTEQIIDQSVQRELTKLLKDQFANIIWRNGEKSLEIVQALQLGVLWYRPPLHYEQHNFYMMVNCAAVMALDLGLGRRPTPNVLKLNVGPFMRSHPNANSIEARRTFLVCYYLCMNITMVLRRPILLRWTRYMEESVNMLETSPEAFPSDRILCQHVKMAHIGEEISVQFSMDDPALDIAISEPKVVYALKVFENELRTLQSQRPNDDDPAIRLAEHVTNLYIHEIALHNQTPPDSQPSFKQEGFTKTGKQDLIGPAHIAALGECLTATHGILDTILNIKFDILLTLPVIFCVRAIYAIVCLMKMWVSVTSPSDMGNIIRKEDLRIEPYTDQLVQLFNTIVSRDAQSPHGKFYYVAKRLQEKFAQIKEGTGKCEMSSYYPGGSQEEEHCNTAPDQKPIPKPRSKPNSATQTPLHLLSEVAMGSSGSPPASQHQHQQHHPQQHQQQQTLQAQQQTQQPTTHTAPAWYNTGISTSQTPDLLPMGAGTGFDPTFDYSNFDFNIGVDADLSALFIPDGVLWNYTDPSMQSYGASW